MLKDLTRNRTMHRFLLLVLMGFLLLLPGRASIPPFDRDEPRYMQATSQMLETGNFVDVRFQDKPRYLQPAGIYWLEALAVSASGTLKQHAVWAYRVPSLLAMTASIGLTAWIGSMLFGPVTGLFAGALFGTSVLAMAEGRMATIDSTLLLTIVLAELILISVAQDREKNRATSCPKIILFWAVLGCGLMLKGPVVLIPGLGTPLAYALINRDKSWIGRLRLSWGWLIMLAIVIPWCIAIGMVSHGEFFQRAVGRNFLGKIGHGQEAHGAPPGFHLAVFGLAFWPGSFFAVASLPFIWMRRHSWQIKFLLCWIIPHWIVFECIATKLPHYVLPTYPAIAILTAFALCRPQEKWIWPNNRWLYRGTIVYGLVCFLIGVALSFSGIVLNIVIKEAIPFSAWFLPVASLPLLIMAFRCVLHGDLKNAAMSAMSAAATIYLILFSSIIPGLRPIWLAPRLAAIVERHASCPNPEVVSSSFSEPSLVFLMHGKVILDTPEVAATVISNNPKCGMALIAQKDFPTFLTAANSHKLHLTQYEHTVGFNYSTGKWLDIGLYGVGAQ
ncbi:ArnT family glycosyltransferase [Acetobacter sp.]|uniref:ArnT family glycosyltransferase n=1 Tax=Acetobacter sp. TaxID=440 RepID=UPI0039EC78DC